ncbi:hypothetical protein [uncultured Formosa sp.]|uniref:hypothetical protein n=1 Tax=uncultured Formosa sp. TaxID=255435 RepID=UPI0026188ACF|nr:hypothetical protein [uncultured Formosa sp.]
MKREIVLTIVLLFCVCGIYAQPLAFENPEFSMDRWKPSGISAVFTGLNIQDGLNIGLGASVPLNSASDVVSYGALLDVNYLYQVRRNFAFGLAAGYGIYFNEEETADWGPIDKGKDFRYFPVAAATRFGLSNGIVMGADIGYAIGASDNFDGGFYFRPLIAYNLSEIFQLNLSYSGISNDWTWSAASVGFTINLND